MSAVVTSGMAMMMTGSLLNLRTGKVIGAAVAVNDVMTFSFGKCHES